MQLWKDHYQKKAKDDQDLAALIAYAQEAGDLISGYINSKIQISDADIIQLIKALRECHICITEVTND